MTFHLERLPVKIPVVLTILFVLVFAPPVVKCLNVHNYCHLLSDAHNPVTLELNLSTFVANTIYQNSMGSRTRLWDASKADIYKANFDQRNVNYLMSSLLELENRESVQQSDVDTIIETLNKMFLVAAEETFGHTCDISLE